MFEDLNEQEYAFSLLDDWATLPRGADLTYEIGERSELIRRLNVLIDAITESEKKTIAAKPERNLVIGFSYESEVLCGIWSRLSYANTPAKLKAVLPDLKLNLLRAMVIGVMLKHEGLELKYLDILPAAEYGNARKKQFRTNAAKATKKRKENYSDDVRTAWERRAEELKAQNPNLSTRDIAKKIADESNNPQMFETVRKHLNKYFG